MNIPRRVKVKLIYKGHRFPGPVECCDLNNKIMFSFPVKEDDLEQELCKELKNIIEPNIVLSVNNVPLLVTVDTCTSSLSEDRFRIRDFNIIVLNQFKIHV